VSAAESGPKAGEFLIARVICDAIFNADIRMIRQLIQRLDGTNPRDIDIDKYSRHFADYMCEVLEYTSTDQLQFKSDDLAILALAKRVYAIAVQDVSNKSVEEKNKRDIAMTIILERVGGKKSAPEKPVDEIEYKAPEWLETPKESKE